MVRGQLTKIERNKLVALITMEIHNRRVPRRRLRSVSLRPSPPPPSPINASRGRGTGTFFSVYSDLRDSLAEVLPNIFDIWGKLCCVVILHGNAKMALIKNSISQLMKYIIPFLFFLKYYKCFRCVDLGRGIIFLTYSSGFCTTVQVFF